ncbi:MAG: hypothetical protein ACLP9L_11620 [Thermoguttaceae bacterium]
MRKVSLLGAVVSLMCLGGGSVSASLTTGPVSPHYGDRIVINYLNPSLPGDNSGGAFVVTDYNLGTRGIGVSWETFCIEAGNADEVFSPGASYILDTTTGVQSNPATMTGNIVTDQAKWVYYQAITNPGKLTGYNALLTSNFTVAESALQLAIWHGELAHGTGGLGSLGTPWDPSAPLNGTQLQQEEYYANLWFNQAPTTWAYDSCVGVINPETGIDGNRSVQSQLYIACIVPEPVSLIVWSVLGAGAAGMALRRRYSGARWSAENRQAIHAAIQP